MTTIFETEKLNMRKSRYYLRFILESSDSPLHPAIEYMLKEVLAEVEGVGDVEATLACYESAVSPMTQERERRRLCDGLDSFVGANGRLCGTGDNCDACAPGELPI